MTTTGQVPIADAGRGDPTLSLVDWLLSPFDAAEFLERTWERETLHVVRDDPAYFESLFGLADLDALLSNTALPVTNLDLAKDDTPLPQDDYARGAFVDMPRVLQLHADGATVILRSIEQWHRGLDQLTRAAGREFGTVAQVNVYATPSAQQSTPPHWDTHDLLILQVHGEKVWRLFDADHLLPLERERFRPGHDRVGPLRDEVLLRPGDVLYLPRGTIHEPRADTYSIHVSLGVAPTRVADVMQEVIRLAAANVEDLRRGIPPAAAGVPDLAVENAVMAGLRSIVDRDLVRAVLAHRTDAMRSLKPEVAGWLTSIASPPLVNDHTRVRRREGVLPRRVEGAPDQVRWSDTSQVLPSAAAAAYVIAHPCFDVEQLSGLDDEAGRVEVVRSLVRGGLLEVI